MRADIVPGAVFPDYELPDHRGKHRKLSELQGDDPLVLVLSRGGFCPKERRQHEGLLQLHREMQVGYCRLVTISTDNLLETNEFRSGKGVGCRDRSVTDADVHAIPKCNCTADQLRIESNARAASALTLTLRSTHLKILMVLTSRNVLGNTGRKTGFWLEEFAAPYFVFRDAGVELTLCSPFGGQPPIGPKSDLPENQTASMARKEYGYE